MHQCFWVFQRVYEHLRKASGRKFGQEKSSLFFLSFLIYEHLDVSHFEGLLLTDQFWYLLIYIHQPNLFTISFRVMSVADNTGCKTRMMTFSVSSLCKDFVVRVSTLRYCELRKWGWALYAQFCSFTGCRLLSLSWVKKSCFVSRVIGHLTVHLWFPRVFNQPVYMPFIKKSTHFYDCG